MKTLKYAVSVQYGGGMHYFCIYHTTQQEAIASASSTRIRLEAAHKAKGRGAKPFIYVWERVQ